MNKYTQLIENYLNGELNEAEKADFEKQLETNAELKKEFELQRQVMRGIENAGLRSEINKGFKKGSFKTKAGKWMLGLAITALAVATVMVVINKIFAENRNIRYELNEQNNKNWSEADEQISPQVFILRGNSDTIIETKGGMVFQIPARAFINSTGNEVTEDYELEIKEALTPLDIMKAGLSTTSEGKLLETGGMFYINARKDGKNLIIPANKNIYASVPDNTNGKKMMLFDGKRMADGQINWIDPKPMESALTTMDIMSLDFYPPHFLDSLQSMGFDISDKKITDSVYYSFACFSSELDAASFNENEDDYGKYTVRSDTVRKPDPEKIFRQNCAVCHSLTKQKLTGPGLEGIMERIPKGEWLKKYIMNSEKMIKSGDPYANKIYLENGKTAMTVFEGTLTDNDISALIQYIGGSVAESVQNSVSSGCEIAPSRIRAIWNKKFNKTLLATKEFEARLKAIFKTCNASVLDLYVKNMDKRMWEIDSLAMVMLGEGGETFREFYNKRQGGVSMKTSELKKLHAYMEEKRTLYEKTARETLQSLYKKEKIEDQRALEERTTHNISEVKRINNVFMEELETNMKEAYRQLDKPYVKAPAAAYFETRIETTGWKNVDVYVFESTSKRETLDYTDPQSGKKAVIRYEPLLVKVQGREDYDRILAYLIPDKLSSFQRMPATVNADFKENLNELFSYSLLVMGFKGETIYSNSIAKAKPGEVSLQLTKMSKKDIEHFSSMNGGASRNILEEFNYQLFEQKENTRRDKIKNREEIRVRLRPVVFPCSVQPAPAGQSSYDESDSSNFK
ncbi:hypothetical protein CNR22_15120 [Sphingobacteriaceae bacterium]|nr:hypothetical protein CNR22_15120 [Sphingobacteriaceae bacterium]